MERKARPTPTGAGSSQGFRELTEYDNIEGPIEDYVELTLQFGT